VGRSTRNDCGLYILYCLVCYIRDLLLLLVIVKVVTMRTIEAKRSGKRGIVSPHAALLLADAVVKLEANLQQLQLYRKVSF
jgi:hypothetical protein